MREGLIRTFGFRLALWYFGLFVAGTALVLLLAYSLLSWALAARDRDIVESTMTRYVRAYQQRGLPGLDAAITADRAGSRYEPLLVRVVTPQGEAVHFSMSADWGRVDISQLSGVVDAQGWGELAVPGSEERLEVVSRMVGGRTLFQVGRSTQRRDELLDLFREGALLLFAMVVAAGWLGGQALSRSALRPLRQMAATVRSILEGGPTTARMPVGSVHDELDALAVLINRMLDRIDTLIAAMRNSLDHVAHDLRTPLTRLRANAETALRAPRSDAEYRAALAELIEESERVSAMLDALMDVAEAEAGTMALHVERVDLSAVVRDAADVYDDIADAKGVALTTSIDDGVEIAGDRNRLAQVISNLLDNAVKYTPAGGQVGVELRATADGAALVVTDNGTGIPPDEIPRIFDRLFRGDQSRSQRGLGLGLSLVKAIVERHGGRVDVASTVGVGSRFTVVLPSSPPAT